MSEIKLPLPSSQPDFIFNLLLGGIISVGALIAYNAFETFQTQTRLKNEGKVVQGTIDWITPNNFSSQEKNARYGLGCDKIILVEYRDASSQTQHLSFKDCDRSYALGKNIDITNVTSVPEFAVLTKDATSPNQLALYLGAGGGLALSSLAAIALIYFRLRPVAEHPKPTDKT